MRAMSSISAAFGVIEFDALNDLADFLDGRVEPARTGNGVDWRNLAGGPAAADAIRSSGRES